MWLKRNVLLLDYENGNKKKYTEYDHTGGFTHFKSSPNNLQVVKTISNLQM